MRKKTKEEKLRFLNKELERLNLYDEDFINKCKNYINLLINQVNEKGDTWLNKNNLIKSNFDFFREFINVVSVLLSVCSLLLIPQFGIIKSLLIFTSFSIFEIINNDFIVKKDKEVYLKFNLLDNIAFKDYMNYIDRNLNRLVKDDNNKHTSDKNTCVYALEKREFYDDFYISDYEREFLNRSIFDDNDNSKNKVFKKVK